LEGQKAKAAEMPKTASAAAYIVQSMAEEDWKSTE